MAESRFYSEILDDALAIADQASGNFALLNASAGLIWLMLSERPTSIDELAAAVSDSTELNLNFSAELLVRNLLEEWTDFGWVEQFEADVFQLLEKQPRRTSRLLPDYLPGSSEWGDLGASICFAENVRLGNQTLRLEVWSAKPVHKAAFGARWAGMLTGIPVSTATPTAIFSYWERDTDYLLDCNGSLQLTSDSASATAILFDAILRFADTSTIDPITLHAAAVSDVRGTILMPAVSGSGKTTLTAALIARGWGYAGDDIVGVGREKMNSNSLQVIPFPTALGLKEGSWTVLATRFPRLKLVAEVAYNQKRVRYLPIEEENHLPITAKDRRSVVALVVPIYDLSVQCQMTPLTRAEALTALIKAGAGSGSDLNVKSISTMMELARTVPAYRLRYADLTMAEHCLGSLL